MPAEVIDPQLNQTEKTWGVLRDLEKNFYAIYRKGDLNSPYRTIGQGTIVDVEKYDKASPAEQWGGGNIADEAFGISINHERTGPVYARLNIEIKEMFSDATGSALTSVIAIQNKMTSMNIPNAAQFDSEYFPK